MSDADVPDRGPAVFAVTTATLALATLFVAARLVSRVLIVRRTAWCDYTIALSWLITVFLCLSITIGARHGLGKYDRDIPPENRASLRMCEYVFSILYSPALIITKISILIFYLRLSKHTQRMLRLASWVTLFVVLTTGIIITFLNIFQCEPTNAAWDITVQPIQCIPLLTEFACSAPVNVVTSLAILALPIPVLTGMRLPMRQKSILVATFALGIFVTIVDVVRIYYLEQALGLVATDITFGQVPDFAWNAAPALMWSAVEVNVAIICACVPTLKPLARRIMPCMLVNRRLRTRRRRSSSDYGSGSGSRSGGKNANETSLSTPPPVLSSTDDAVAGRRPSSFSQTSSSGDISLRHFLLASNTPRAPAASRPPALPSASYPKQTHFSPSGPSYRHHPHLSTFINTPSAADDNNSNNNTHPHHHHHHPHPHKPRSINRLNMLTLTPSQTLLACTPPAILFFLWGFSSGLLVSLNTTAGNPLSGMSQAQMLGLMGVFYGGGYLVGPVVGGWVLRRGDEGYVSVWRGWGGWWRGVKRGRGTGRGKGHGGRGEGGGNGWSWRWGVRRGREETGGDGGDGEVDEEEGQEGLGGGGGGQTRRRGIGCIGWEHRWGRLPGLRKLPSATTTTSTSTSTRGGGGRRRSDEVHVAEQRVGGFKATFIAGLLIYGAGSITFWPPAVLEAYGGFMVSNFLVGMGLAVLETAANPFLVLCGPPRYADARLLLAQGLEAVGGLLGVLLADKVFSVRVPGGVALLGVQWTYMAVTLLSVLLALVFYYVPLPEVSGAQLAEVAASRRRADPRRRWGLGGVSLRTWAVGLAVLAQWCYISAQETVSLFLGSLITVFNDQHPSRMGLSRANFALVAHAAFALSRFLAAALCCVSARFPTSPFLPKPQTLLAASIVSSTACILAVVVLPSSTDPRLAAIPVILLAFFMGPIWPLIFSLGLRGQGERTKLAAMWITMGGFGAGVWPFVSYGILRTGGSYQIAMVVVVALMVVAGVYPLFLGTVKRARDFVDVPCDGESRDESEIELRRGSRDDDKKGPSAVHLEGGLLGQQLSPGWPGTRGSRLLGSDFDWDPKSRDQGRQADQRAPWEDQALDTSMLRD